MTALATTPPHPEALTLPPCIDPPAAIDRKSVV